jgi:methylated-DNA-[protein]-cysteine S-methyltransferase
MPITSRNPFFVEWLATPVGTVLLVTDDVDRLRAIDWIDHQPRLLRLLRRHYGSLPDLNDRRAPSRARRALEAYLAGELAAVDDLAVETGGTPFQKRVWSALRTIPAGVTISYAALAARIGRPRAVRAVGLANGANPVGIVVPCHRVIGADGSLTGYRGGLERKRWLLAHEGAWLPISDTRLASLTISDTRLASMTISDARSTSHALPSARHAGAAPRSA